jgi:hypothetical protein
MNDNARSSKKQQHARTDSLKLYFVELDHFLSNMKLSSYFKQKRTIDKAKEALTKLKQGNNKILVLQQCPERP